MRHTLSSDAKAPAVLDLDLQFLRRSLLDATLLTHSLGLRLRNDCRLFRLLVCLIALPEGLPSLLDLSVHAKLRASQLHLLAWRSLLSL